MNRILVAALAAPLLVAACAVPGNASPAPTVTVTETEERPAPEPDTAQGDDATYLGFLRSKGIMADADTTIEVGRSVCKALDDGFEPQLLMMLAMDAGFTTDQAAAIVAAAIMTYCPWNETKVNS